MNVNGKYLLSLIIFQIPRSKKVKIIDSSAARFSATPPETVIASDPIPQCNANCVHLSDCRLLLFWQD